MKIKDFYELIELRKEPEASLLPNLQYRTRKYPFFQPDIFIYIKCLYLSNSDDFVSELNRLSPFITDRKALFYYVMNDEYKQFQKKAEKRLTQNRTDMLINAFFETLNEPEGELTLDIDSPALGANLASSDYFSYLNSMEGGVEEPDTASIPELDIEDDILEIEEGILTPYDYKSREKVNVVSEELEEDDDIPRLKHQEIIDRFIEKAATEDTLKIQLVPSEDTISEDELDNPEPEGRELDLENDYFFTQTLANIYIKQKKYQRAYEIIKHLSLNYPEKNIYFADQLSFLEKLLKNSNKK